MWGLNTTFGIDAPDAWALTTGSSSVVVAVLDTGIRTHEDLDATKQLPGYDMISDTLIANDGNVRDADPTDPGDGVDQAALDGGSWPSPGVSHQGQQLARHACHGNDKCVDGQRLGCCIGGARVRWNPFVFLVDAADSPATSWTRSCGHQVGRSRECLTMPILLTSSTCHSEANKPAPTRTKLPSTPPLQAVRQWWRLGVTAMLMLLVPPSKL